MPFLGSRRARRVIEADRVLRDRIGTAMNACIRRGLIGHALRLRLVLVALHRLSTAEKRHIDSWIDAIFFVLGRAKKEFENAVRDEPTLASCYELEGAITAARAVDAAIDGYDWKLRNPFDCIVPAESDPIAGPRIRARVARWRTRATA
jgi:hypothetical protein